MRRANVPVIQQCLVRSSSEKPLSFFASYCENNWTDSTNARTVLNPRYITASCALEIRWGNPKNAELTSCKIFEVIPMSLEMISVACASEGSSLRNSSVNWVCSAGKDGKV